MPLNLANHEAKAKAAVKRFWTGQFSTHNDLTSLTQFIAAFAGHIAAVAAAK